MKEKKLHTPKGNVVYWTSDCMDTQRETLVLLHGLSADHTLFDQQVCFFEKHYNLIVWDSPAHGKSRPFAEMTYPCAARLLKRILEENNVSSAVMIGQSMGGYIIQSFLLRYPNMVKAFVGIDTCPYGTAYYSPSDLFWLRQVEWMSALYPEKLLKKSIARNATETKAGYENMYRALAPYGKQELCRLLGMGYTGFLQENRNMRIPCPVLIVVGAHDRTGKVRQYCVRWHEKTGYPLCVIPKAAHNSNYDNPQAVNRTIAAFLKQIL